MEEKIILVDKNNRKIGTEEKMKVHELGLLHRAFSIFVFNEKGELLLQKRAKEKYHSGGLWTNTCCSHQRPNEELSEAIHRRLVEEMGFDCELKKVFDFSYRTEFGNGLIENEYDCVFVGKSNKIPIPNKEEVEDYKWILLKELKEDIEENPEEYTYWMRVALKKTNYFKNT